MHYCRAFYHGLCIWYKYRLKFVGSKYNLLGIDMWCDEINKHKF